MGPFLFLSRGDFQDVKGSKWASQISRLRQEASPGLPIVHLF